MIWPRNRQRARPNKLRSQQWNLFELEPRLLLAGDVGPAVAASVSGAAAGTDAAMATDAAAAMVAPKHLVIVDSSVAHATAWSEAIPTDAELVVLTPTGDPISQLSRVLSGHTNLQSVHLFCHGNDGSLQIGDTRVTLESITDRAGELQRWGSAFAEDGDLLIYGCDVASGSRGIELVQTIARNIGVDVAASSDRSGSAAHAGNWDLEHRVGNVQFDRVVRRQTLDRFEGYLAIEIIAAGQMGDELMELQIGNSVVSNWVLAGTDGLNQQYNTYTYQQDGVSPNEIRINFVNDFSDPSSGIDRNLFVDKIVVDGVEYETEDPSVFANGAFDPSLQAVGYGFLQTERLDSNGFFLFAGSDVTPQSSISTHLNLNLNGSASYEGNELQLTGLGNREVGSAYTDAPISFEDSTSFQTSFSFRIGGGVGGADGLAFLLQNSADGNSALGQPGGYMGYDNLDRSVAIEFDTYKNGGEVSGNSIGVVVNGDSFNALAEVSVPTLFNTDQTMYAWVDYDGPSNLLSVYFSDTNEKPGVAALQTEIALDQVLGGEAFAGFSAGNYDLPNSHRITSWSFTSVDGPITENAGRFELAKGQVFVDEGEGSAQIEVIRTGGSSGIATIEYATSNGNATAGSDYVATAGLLVFADGETSKTISIDILDDGAPELAEDFTVELAAPLRAGLGSPSQTRVTVIDDDLGTPNFPDFASNVGLQFNGSATTQDDLLVLTSAGNRQAGSAFFQAPIAVEGSTSFQTAFAFEVGDGSGTAGADGFAFLLQGSSDGAGALGSAGGFLGYQSIDRSIAIEFDTHQNAGDLSNNSIGIVVNGDVWNAVAEVEAPFDINSGSRYNAWVDYDGDANTLSVFVSASADKPETAVLETQIDLEQILGGAAYAGFTAGTYDVPNQHAIASWSLILQKPAPPAPKPGNFAFAKTATSVTENQGSVQIEIVRQGGSSGAASVAYRAIPGSALAGEDYSVADGRISFGDGETSKTITVTIANDSEGEPVEEFTLELSDPSVAGLSGLISTRVVIADDDLGLPAFSSFPTDLGLNLNGAAKVDNDQLVIIDADPQQAGSAFFQTPLSITEATSFETAFSYEIGQGSGPGGADGFSFILQNSPEGADAIGQPGGYLAYDAIANSLAIEFDTYKNAGDASGNSVSVVLNGDTWNHVVQAEAPFDLNDGQQQYAWISYDSLTETLSVFLSKTPDKPADALLQTEVKLDQILGDTAYAGFTAGNYNLPNRHAISSWTMNLEESAVAGSGPGSFTIVTSEPVVIEGQGFVEIEVSRVGGSTGEAFISYSTVEEDAFPGQDYIPTSGDLRFADGVTSRTIYVELIDDDVSESTEQFSVRIDNPINAGLLAPRTSIVTILDDDSGLPRYLDFASAYGLELNGSASLFEDELQLTGVGARQAGSAFYQTPISVDETTSFRSAFSFVLGGGPGTNGADGLAFVMQNSPEAANALGEAGGYLGYNLISDSLAIEFDTYLNGGWDESANSISVVINGDVENAVAEAPALFDLNNGTRYYAWIEYNGDSDILAVYLSDRDDKPAFALLKTEIALDEIVGNLAFAGFSAGTYDQPNYHRVGQWTLALDAPPADPPLNPTGDIVELDLYSGLIQPVAVDWSPDGRNMFVAEKGGVIKVARDGAASLSELLDISDQVNNVADRGLIDFAIDPDFENNGFIYLLFTYDPPEVFLNEDNALAGPDGSGNRAGRLVRYTADASTGFTTIVENSEKVILGSNSTWDNFNAFVNSTFNIGEPQGGYDPETGYVQDFINSDSLSHTVGSLAWGNDGSLFVSMGDGASYNRTDPRALRVQDVNSLAGKVLRIDPETGNGLPDNPFVEPGDELTLNRTKVFQLGLRNPWRLSVDSGTGQLYIGDTGLASYEEINTGDPGANFGWPLYEGAQGFNSRTPGYRDLGIVKSLYPQVDATPAEIALKHQAGTDVVVLGSIVYGSELGFQYDGDLFYNDLARGIVRHANILEDGSIGSISVFTTGAQFVVDIQQGIDGSLYYVNLLEGTVGKWTVA